MSLRGGRKVGWEDEGGGVILNKTPIDIPGFAIAGLEQGIQVRLTTGPVPVTLGSTGSKVNCLTCD